jgi:hypothetical protein
MPQRSNRIAIAGALSALGGAGIIAVATAETNEASAAYHPPWSRANAYSLGVTGLYEGYQYGHSKWNDNNVQDDWPTEGADCSGYAGKVWAAPVYTAIGTEPASTYPYTGLWYAGSVDGSVNIPLSDSRTRKMDAWVMRKSAGATYDHMGVFQGTYSSGQGGWKIWHAANEDAGIKESYYSNTFMTSNSVKRFKRANW